MTGIQQYCSIVSSPYQTPQFQHSQCRTYDPIPRLVFKIFYPITIPRILYDRVRNLWFLRGSLLPGFILDSYEDRLKIEAGAGARLYRWEMPRPGFVVVNCDASFRPSRRSVGYGVIIRDEKGEVLVAKANHREAIDPKECHEHTVLVQEMIAIREGIRLAKKMEFKCIEVRSDSKDAVNIVMRGITAQYPKECGDVLKEIKDDLAGKSKDHSGILKCGFRFVHRESNRPADFLSKFLRRNDDEDIILEPSEMPYDLKKIVDDDAKGHYVARVNMRSHIVEIGR